MKKILDDIKKGNVSFNRVMIMIFAWIGGVCLVLYILRLYM